MNILRWQRKSKKKIKFKTLILFIFSLIMTTFAWFAYSKVLNTSLNFHMVSWDMQYFIGAVEKENPIGIEISALYPTMPQQTVTIDIKNNGEKAVDIEYYVQSVTIAGQSFEIVPEGGTNTTDNYIALAKSVLVTDANTGAKTYKGVITNDITRFPFTVEVEHSAQVAARGQGYLKITVNWIGDNSELDSEWGYKVGEYLTANPTATSAMSIVLSIDSYQVDEKAVAEAETLPSTTETKPYLPTGFTRVPGTNLDTGLVIKDASGNEYVWIEVPRNTTVYGGAGLNITSFTTTEYTSIETDLKAYSAAYRTRDDVFTSYDATGIAKDNYNPAKQSMLKSIYQNGGFYIGRYETGIADSFRTTTSESTPSETPVIKANAYPYNYITCSQAQAKATTMDSGSYTSSLMFGLQWDLVMKYLETKGASSATLTTDSTSWGNYTNNTYDLTNAKAKYSLDNGITWLVPVYSKPVETSAILTTGANSRFCRQNIYDLAGNLAEWTFNLTFNGSTPVGGNGGDYLDNGANSATYRNNTYDSTKGQKQIGFRVTIY